MDLPLEKLKKLLEALSTEALPIRNPIFHFCPHIEAIYQGKEVDRLIKIKWPAFNTKYDQGFLVPMEYKATIQDYFEFIIIV